MEDKHREAAGKEAARGIRYLEAGFSHSHFAGFRVVAGGTAFNHLVAESGARHDERSEIATAKAECAEGKYDDKFRERLTHRSVLLRQYPKP
jgi:hypothetical protein